MKIEFRVEGMSCQHCTAAVTHAIREHDPDAKVQIDLAGGYVTVESDQSVETVQSAIAEAGYEVTGAPVIGPVTG